MSDDTPGIRLMPGTRPRNGLPERRGYVYRGLGVDLLTAGMSNASLEAGLPARGSAAVIRQAVERYTPVSGAALIALMCPACRDDDCGRCEHGGCKCACQDEAPPPPAPAAPERCEDCGYLVTAPGHKIACGGAS